MYYAEFFRLTEPPFSIAPNPRFLFMSERHREALAHLLFGVVNGNGFVALTGEVGTGKTTLCHCLLEQLPDNVDLALILNPRVDAKELLATICDELRIRYPEKTSSLKILSDALNAHLLESHARGRNTVLLIDEAQNLSFDVLEQVRLLTNLETSETKLLQIILVGQPELNTLLGQTNLRQLNQRITARYHIHPLSLDECQAYIEHRLSVSGAQMPIFTSNAIRCAHRLSDGIPRVINTICDRALLGAYSTGIHRVNASIVRKSANEVLLPEQARESGYRSILKFLAVSAFVLIVGTLAYQKIDSGFSSRLWDRVATSEQTVSNQANRTPAVDPQPIYRELFESLVPASASTIDTNQEFAQTGNELAAMVANETARLKPKLFTIAEKNPPEPDFVTQISAARLDLYSTLPHLFSQWGIADEPKFKNLCASARRSGLRCLVQQGTWHQLVRLNRPVTLEFSLQRGHSQYATLVAVNKHTATFLFAGDTPYSFPIEEILPYWQGNYTLLWKPPARDVALLMEGYSNPGVIWLRQNLPGLDSREHTNSTRFDKPLKDAVIAFQTRLGLKADGKVGSETVIFINNQNESSGVPRLDSGKE